MPGVVSVQPRVQGGLLDSVMKGLQVARDVYGIRHDDAQTDLLNQRAGQEQQAFNDQQSGVFTPKEQVALGRNYDFVPEGTSNALPIKVRQGAGGTDTQDVYILPKKENSPLLQTVQNMVDPVSGDTGTGTYDMKDGSLLNFVKTQAPDKPQRMFTPTVLGNGNVGAFDATTGQVTDTGSAAGAKPKADTGAPGTDKADAKAASEQAKAYTEMTKIVNGGRGAPPNVQQAMSAQTAVNKALELIKQAPGGDLNKLSPIQVKQLNSEIGKIATGGVPTEAEQAGLDPKTFASQFASLLNRGTGPNGTVSGADLGPFIQQNVDYLKGLNGVLNDTVHKFQRSTFDDYADSGRISDEHQSKFQARHPELFPELGGGGMPVATGGAQSAPAPKPEAGTAYAAPAGAAVPAQPHPQDVQALQWAQQNRLSKDPAKADMALKILQVNGSSP